MENGITIKQLDGNSTARWDRFVDTSPEATFFHYSGWKHIIECAFAHKAYFLYAEQDGEILGILPLGHIKSLLFGNALISSPFCVYGGIAAKTAEARSGLDRAAGHLARELKVDYLEMRNRLRHRPERPHKALYVTFRKELAPDNEENLHAIPRKQRAMVRKGIKAGLHSVIDRHVDRFYDAFAESVRNLGTPVFSKHYFSMLKEVFGDQCEILTVEHEDRVVSSVMSFYFRDEVLPYYGGGTHLARHLKGNDFMYWEVMRRAVEQGVKIFDYGRSKQGTGSYRFKKHWGFEAEPLYYEYDLVNASDVPDVNPLNPKYRLFIALWQKLPVSVSKRVGPWISRNLG